MENELSDVMNIVDALRELRNENNILKQENNILIEKIVDLKTENEHYSNIITDNEQHDKKDFIKETYDKLSKLHKETSCDYCRYCNADQLLDELKKECE